jgi:acetylornithine deacetylase/succinyl-diaminopimelate desuccinylase-like protein
MNFRGLACLFVLLLFLPAGADRLRAQQTPAAAPAKPPAAALPAEVGKVANEALGWLTDLLRFDTTNPPGNEQAAAKYIAGILEKEGIPAELLEAAPGRSAVVARLRSTVMPDPSRALLLVAHLDVVGVDKAKWSVDPFGGVTKDGYLYGRGAVDDKGMVAANLASLIALKRTGARLKRDVIFLASTDEEQSGAASIKTLMSKYWDKFAAGYALNEGGNVLVKNGKVQSVGIQASEKVAFNVTVIARGTSGHASIPRKDNAVVHLAAAIAKIGEYSAPAKPTTIVRRYFEQIAKVEDQETSKWIRALDQPERAAHAQRVLSDMNPVWNSMLRDSISPTMLEAGVRANVIPAEARAILNIRLLPGNSIDALVADLAKTVNDPQIRFEVQKDGTLPAPPSSLDNEFYQTIERVSAQEFPDAAVVPYQSTWGTDSAQLRLHNVQAYGLVPFPLTAEDLGRMHGEDERIPMAAFEQGVKYLYRIVADFAVAK